MRRLCVVALLVVLSATVFAQMSVQTYETVTVGAAAVGLSAATLVSNGKQVQSCTGRLETAQIRIGYVDVVTPTAAVGTLVEIGDMVTITGHDNIKRWRAIRTGSSGTITFFCAVK